MRRNRKTEGFEKAGYSKTVDSNVTIFKQRNGKSYKKYKLVPIISDKYYLVNTSDILYPYIVKKGYISREAASLALKKFYTKSKRDSFSILRGKKLLKIKPVLNGEVKFKLPKEGGAGVSLRVGTADKISLAMTYFYGLEPKIGKIMNKMFFNAHRINFLYTDPQLLKRVKQYKFYGVRWPYHSRIAIALEDAIRELYPDILHLKLIVIGLMVNEPKVFNKMGKALTGKEYERLKSWEESNGVTKHKKLFESMARGFQNYKTELGEYKLNVDLVNESYLIIPLGLISGYVGNNRDPILIYPKSFMHSINDEESREFISYHKRKRYSHDYFTIWDAWKLMDSYCIPRVADIHKSNNISRELKRKKKLR